MISQYTVISNISHQQILFNEDKNRQETSWSIELLRRAKPKHPPLAWTRRGCVDLNFNLYYGNLWDIRETLFQSIVVHILFIFCFRCFVEVPQPSRCQLCWCQLCWGPDAIKHSWFDPCTRYSICPLCTTYLAEELFSNYWDAIARSDTPWGRLVEAGKKWSRPQECTPKAQDVTIWFRRS